MEVRARGHRLPRARSSGRTKGRHWGRSPSASGPTWAPQPRSASRPPRLTHCAGACGRKVLAGGEGGRTAAANPEPVTPLARGSQSGHGPYPSTRASEQECQERSRIRHAGGNTCPLPTGPGLTSLTTEEENEVRGRTPGTPPSAEGTHDTGSGWGNPKALPASSGD